MGRAATTNRMSRAMGRRVTLGCWCAFVAAAANAMGMAMLGRCAFAAAANRMGRCAGRETLCERGFGMSHTEMIILILEKLCAKFDWVSLFNPIW